MNDKIPWKKIIATVFLTSINQILVCNFLLFVLQITELKITIVGEPPEVYLLKELRTQPFNLYIVVMIVMLIYSMWRPRGRTETKRLHPEC